MCASSPHHGRHHGEPRLIMSGLARTYRAATVAAMASITVRPDPAARPVNGSGRFGISCVRTCRLLWREWPHDTPGAPATGEKRPYPDGSNYIQPQLAPAGAIDVTSRAAPRPTGGPITQRETQRPADGFPAESGAAIGATKVRRVGAQIRQFWRFARDLTGMGCGCPVSSGATEVELPGFL